MVGADMASPATATVETCAVEVQGRSRQGVLTAGGPAAVAIHTVLSNLPVAAPRALWRELVWRALRRAPGPGGSGGPGGPGEPLGEPLDQSATIFATIPAICTAICIASTARVAAAKAHPKGGLKGEPRAASGEAQALDCSPQALARAPERGRRGARRQRHCLGTPVTSVTPAVAVPPWRRLGRGVDLLGFA